MTRRHWRRFVTRWQIAAEQTGGRLLWGQPATGTLSLLWGRKTRMVRV